MSSQPDPSSRRNQPLCPHCSYNLIGVRTIPWRQVREIDIADAEFADPSSEALTLVIRALPDGSNPALAEVVAIEEAEGLSRRVHDALMHRVEQRR